METIRKPAGGICGLWVDGEGNAYVSRPAGLDGRQEEVLRVRPFCWVDDAGESRLPEVARTEDLSGPGRYRHLARFENVGEFNEFVAVERRAGHAETVRPLEAQYLLETGNRFFAGMRFGDLRRCQLDIETACAKVGGFSDARRKGDRVLAIGLQFGQRREILILKENSDEAERELLEGFADVLRKEDPDTVEGHNLFRFDLDFLRRRCRRLNLPCAWGRFGMEAVFRPARLRVAERWIEYPRCEMAGRTVLDTYLLALLYDLTSRELSSFGLKEVAVHFGVTSDELLDRRTYIEGGKIEDAFYNDRENFLAYLGDDLRETKGIADLLLPTYFAQAADFPISPQDAALRGSGGKIDLLMLREYLAAREALPVGSNVAPYAGGFAGSFATGVFRDVLHFDVASLYPSILLNFGRNPANDSLGAFIPLLRRLRDYRLQYKKMAREASDPDLRVEYQARQASFKVLINSFYGYLGFSGARFADGELAARVTEEGRRLMEVLLAAFSREGCRALEADTDGIYLTAGAGCSDPEELLKRVGGDLPPGIDLEFDGRYEAMFCYKAKNYALYNGGKVILKGSALRSRGMEPYLRHLTHRFIDWMLGIEEQSPKVLAEEYRGRLFRREVPVEEVCRSENIGQSPEAYRKAVESGSAKVRRPALEAALRKKPVPRLGDRVRYYVAAGASDRAVADWQRAMPVEAFHPEKAPYDGAFYARKIDDWLRRYEEFIDPTPRAVQGELF